ncbi:MAG TPA: hypothetical protein ENO00_03910 [Deltaproteobacteria bacterium]|nr:hypothetical protein [Deltaproteobacteria bacterium]
MIPSVLYWLLAALFVAGAVMASMIISFRRAELEVRPILFLLGAIALLAAVAFFLPLQVFSFRVLVWVLGSWLGLAGLASLLRALFAGDDFLLAWVGLIWMATALLLGSREAATTKTLSLGPVPWLVGAGLLLLILLIIRGALKHLASESYYRLDEGVAVLAAGVVAITAAGSFLPTTIGIYRIASWVIFSWLILFGLLLVFHENQRGKGPLILILIGGAFCVVLLNPLLSLGMIVRSFTWGLSKIWIPVLVLVFLVPGGILFCRGLLGQGWLWTLGGYCLLQAAFGLALAGKYVQSVSLRLGWEGGAVVPWLVFNAALVAIFVLLVLGWVVFALASRVKSFCKERGIARLTRKAARLDGDRPHELVDLAGWNLVRVSAWGWTSRKSRCASRTGRDRS